MCERERGGKIPYAFSLTRTVFSFGAHRIGKEPAGTTREQIIYAKKLYESAFHPDTGELQNVFGRMSFQVPGGMAVTGFMLQFYRYTNFIMKYNIYVYAELRLDWLIAAVKTAVTSKLQSFRLAIAHFAS